MDRLQQLRAEAYGIRAAAEQRDGMLSAAECDRLDVIFAEIDSLDDGAAEPSGRGRRLTAPNMPGAGATASYPPSTGRHGLSNGERLIDRHGQEIAILASADRFADQVPRGERLPLSDLGAMIYGAASGDFSRVSDRCRSVMAQQGGQSDAAGGVLIPAPLSAEVIDAIRDASVFMRSGARSIAMSSRTLDYGRVVTPPAPAWRAEHAVIQETDVVLDRVTLEARNLGCMVRSSIELLDDSPAASGLLRNLLAVEMAASFDTAMLTGTGGLQPVGIVTMASDSPPLVQIVTPADTQDYADWVSALGLLWAVNTNPTAVMVSARTRAALAALDTGNPQTAIRPPADLAALPWLVTAKLQQSGSPQTSASVIGDFSTCVVGIRQQVRISVSEAGGEYESDSPPVSGDAFARNQLRIRATLRADLCVHQPSKLVVLTGITD